VGNLSLPMNDSSVLKIGPDGGLVLGFAVKGPHRTPESNPQFQFDEKPSYWRIDDLSLELTGKVVERK